MSLVGLLVEQELINQLIQHTFAHLLDIFWITRQLRKVFAKLGFQTATFVAIRRIQRLSGYGFAINFGRAGIHRTVQIATDTRQGKRENDQPKNDFSDPSLSPFPQFIHQHESLLPMQWM